jgi:hypothetical protein
MPEPYKQLMREHRATVKAIRERLEHQLLPEAR